MSNISTEWLKNVRDPSKREEVEKTLRASQTLVRRLLEIVDDWEHSLDVQEVKLEDYESPAWGPKQAHRNGQRSIHKRLKDLLRPLQES